MEQVGVGAFLFRSIFGPATLKLYLPLKQEAALNARHFLGSRRAEKGTVYWHPVDSGRLSALDYLPGAPLLRNVPLHYLRLVQIVGSFGAALDDLIGLPAREYRVDLRSRSEGRCERARMKCPEWVKASAMSAASI